jgi:hypothetical protein
MKPFIAIILIVNTVIFGIFTFNSIRTFKLTEQHIEDMRVSLDTANVRLQKINASLDDKLYGIISNLPKR